MAMEISNDYSSYASSYTNTTDNKKKTTESSTTKTTESSTANTAESSTVKVAENRTTKEEYLSELNKRHSRLNIMTGGVNKNSGTDSVQDFYSYLQKNYDCMSSGNVTISGEYLKKCSGNSAKAKELEDFLKRIPELEKQGYEQLSAQNKALGGTVTYYQQTWMVNKDGSIQSTVYSVTETGMTNAERMKKNINEQLEKQKKKKEEEKEKEKKEEKTEQAEKRNGDTEKISVPEEAEPEISVKYVEAESESEAKAMMQKEKREDAYYPKFDVNV